MNATSRSNFHGEIGVFNSKPTTHDGCTNTSPRSCIRLIEVMFCCFAASSGIVCATAVECICVFSGLSMDRFNTSDLVIYATGMQGEELPVSVDRDAVIDFPVERLLPICNGYWRDHCS